MSHPVSARELENDEDKRLFQIVRRGSDLVVPQRRAQMVQLSVCERIWRRSSRRTSPALIGPGIYCTTSTGTDWIRYSLTTPVGDRRNLARNSENKTPRLTLGRSFSTWSWPRLAGHLVNVWAVEGIFHEVPSSPPRRRSWPKKSAASWRWPRRWMRMKTLVSGRVNAGQAAGGGGQPAATRKGDGRCEVRHRSRAYWS